MTVLIFSKLIQITLTKKKIISQRLTIFFYQKNYKQGIKGFNILTEAINLSDHNPIYCELDTCFFSKKDIDNQPLIERKFHQFNWKDQIFAEKYQQILSTNLEPLLQNIDRSQQIGNFQETIEEIFTTLPRILLKSARYAEELVIGKKKKRKTKFTTSNFEESCQIADLIRQTNSLY